MIDSPCTAACSIDRKTGLCKGCRRTGKEISNWVAYTNLQKQQVLKKLKKEIQLQKVYKICYIQS